MESPRERARRCLAQLDTGVAASGYRYKSSGEENAEDPGAPEVEDSATKERDTTGYTLRAGPILKSRKAGVETVSYP